MYIEFLVIHCTATPEGRDVSKKDIERWHLTKPPVGRGWSRLGYSDLIALDGSLINLTPFDTNNEIDYHEMTWGVAGINRISRHVVYAGGMDRELKYAKDTRTRDQLQSMETYVKYTLLRYPFIRIAGHNQFSNKDCPSFNVPNWLRIIGVKEENIYEI